ncbi:branched-chain amino acid ABC transporter permease [Pelagibius litoralis]|uniref:Branched-chain amino acid ABC transporter permease n=1 Tax=Pelagibius litoralis TaxID=374515 RepID=A0A967KFZ0_9PROT|nr:branched-chain amino acid ABC transporter permease [Pelagibius litoralis]NIA69931.1 branched-chain amino acid ABC transporter permease [Pelagibius litoralis]
MRTLAAIAVFGFAMAVLPAFGPTDFMLSFLTLMLLFAYLGQGWNILGGYGGQFSFGNTVFFGAGLYVTVITQVQFGLGPWAGLAAALLAGAAVAFAIGWLSFRYGLRGSYFALITLAFAEVFRIVANSIAITGAGAGLQVPLDPSPANLQFVGREGFYWIILALTVGSLLLAWQLERSRFGVYLIAIRDDEDAARALGVDIFRTKLRAIVLVGAMTALGGAFYGQMFLYVDPHIAFGVSVSVEVLLVSIVGGMGTVFGPLLGAAALHTLSEVARETMGDTPGLNLALYGALLVVMVMFLPKGLFGLASFSARRLLKGWRS